MDKLAKQLREDAANINVEVSAELDDRIRASLHGVTPERSREKDVPQRPRSTWWASSLTGIVAVTVVIVLLNLDQPEPLVPLPTSPTERIFNPRLQLNTVASTEPLRKELEDLEADLKKAEEALRKEIGLFP